jgi:hypothetical protein
MPSSWLLKSVSMCWSTSISAHAGIPGVVSIQSYGWCCVGGEIMRFGARLRRLEAMTERQPMVFKVVWDDGDDEGLGTWRVIRLRWGDDREAAVGDTPETP